MLNIVKLIFNYYNIENFEKDQAKSNTVKTY
jgi:hypothetical protein